MVGEQFGVRAGDELCGVVVAMRPNEDTISVWNRTAANKDATTRIRCVPRCVMTHFSTIRHVFQSEAFLYFPV